MTVSCPDVEKEGSSASRFAKKHPVLIAAPGAGLGHLVRAWAISSELSKLGIGARVVTHSTYALGLSRLTGCAIDFIPASRWKQAISSYCEKAKPDLVVLDTFPWGIRGEWAHAVAHRSQIILLARRLNVSAYLHAAGMQWNASSPVPQHVIVSEPLSLDYRGLLEASACRLDVLPGRIRLVLDDLPWRKPPGLVKRLLQKPTWLVVHSGPAEEVGRLLALARDDMKGCGDGQMIAIVPEEARFPGVLTFQFFPAALLYPYAHRVVTAAGYNCIAETAPWREKHLGMPFSRRYDEQEERFREARTDSDADRENGVYQTARHIASLL